MAKHPGERQNAPTQRRTRLRDRPHIDTIRLTVEVRIRAENVRP